MDNSQDKISKILSDPENIKTIARIAAGFMPSESGEKSETSGISETSSGAEDKDDVNANKASAISGTHGDDIPASLNLSEADISGGLLGGIFSDVLTPEKVDRGIGFLGALKPYLGSHKKEVCEIMIKVLGAAKLLTIYKS